MISGYVVGKPIVVEGGMELRDLQMCPGCDAVIARRGCYCKRCQQLHDELESKMLALSRQRFFGGMPRQGVGVAVHHPEVTQRTGWTDRIGVAPACALALAVLALGTGLVMAAPYVIAQVGLLVSQ